MNSKEKENKEYDQHVDFYYTNLINSLVLFSLSKADLEKLVEPAFDPIYELESEIDYAFTPVCFESIFRYQLIDERFKAKLLNFKLETDDIPNEIWDWEFIDSHPTWIKIRKRASNLLDNLGITDRTYSEDYTTVYDKNGNVIKKGKNCS